MDDFNETKQQIINKIKAHKELLFNKYPIKYLALFGAMSRGDYHEHSDVDILVDFEKDIGIEFIDLADELEAILDKKVDLVSKNGLKEKYYQFLKKELEYV